MKKVFSALFFLVGPWAFANPSWGQCGMAGGSGSDHQHSNKQHGDHQMSQMGQMSHGLVKNYTVDGYNVSFNLMEKNEFLEMTKAMEDEVVAKHEGQMAGKNLTHHVAVVILDGETGKRRTDIPIKLKVVTPSGTVDTKPWGWMDNHYCGYLTLEKPGEYVILASFKADGEDHSVGFVYDLKAAKN